MIRSTRIQRLGFDGLYVMKQFPKLACLLYAYVKNGQQDAEYDRVAELTSRFVTRTEFTGWERNYFRRILEERKLSAWALPLSFFRLPDSLERRFLMGRALEFHHIARAKLIREYLPPANQILDLGGAVDIHPEGALLALGYPHKPKRIFIVDLPDESRSHPRLHKLRDSMFNNVSVRYVYTGMQDLKQFRGGKFDLVWSGQSIEHVSREDARKVIREAFRVLRPGGFFCLDTPNRRLTQLIAKSYLHPEHCIEYFPEDLASELRDAGFEIYTMKAVTPLPISLRLGKVSKLEMFREARVSDDYHCGFSFFIHSRKPI
jgi:ubiquinone/menaquinone biosynthesis C-methylase UbiE